jgi:hypothetical protein
MGNYMETAAAFAGVHKSTLYEWLKKGAKSKSGIYKEFSDAVKKALAEAEVRDVAIISQAAKESWQASAWRLERKFPDKWGKKAIKNDNPAIEEAKLAKLHAEIELINQRINQLKDTTEGTSDLVDDWVRSVLENDEK